MIFIMYRVWICYFLIPLFCAQAKVCNSTIPRLDEISKVDLSDKINRYQKNKIKKASPYFDTKLRIMTYNMLFNLPDIEANLDPCYHWVNRLPRIVEYIKFAKPDIIGSQELYIDQIKDLMEGISDEYDYYGEGREKKMGGEVQAIFYKKNRFKLIGKKTYFIDKKSVYDTNRNTLIYAKFKDIKTGKEFIVLNTHLSFSDADKRLYEAYSIRKIIQSLPKNIPIILTGDFNTFPARLDINFPFYDGDHIIKILTTSRMHDSRNRAVFGSIGPIATTNFCQKLGKNFIGEGTPGVFLDRIFVSSDVLVLSNAVDPAKVNENFGSDHYPVLSEVALP